MIYAQEHNECNITRIENRPECSSAHLRIHIFKKHLSCLGYVHAQEEKMVSTSTVRDPKIDPFPTGDNICGHTKADDNLSILGKNKTIKTENTKEQSVTV